MNDKLLPKSLFYLLVILITIPFVLVLLSSFVNWTSFKELQFHFEGYSKLLVDYRLEEIARVILRSVLVASVATLISFVVAYLLIFTQGKSFRNVFLFLITLPFLINESMRAFSWYPLLATNGFLNAGLSKVFGNEVDFFSFSNNANVTPITVLGILSVGVFINTLVIDSIDKSIWKAAKDTGASAWTIFSSIGIPMGSAGIIFSFVTITLLSLSMSAEVALLGGDTKLSLRILISSLLSAGEVSAVFALGSLLLVTSLVSIVGVLRIFKKSL
ncbi:MAG: hypothetical protein AAF740_13775 [Bacteroidota bacterium]